MVHSNNTMGKEIMNTDFPHYFPSVSLPPLLPVSFVFIAWYFMLWFFPQLKSTGIYIWRPRKPQYAYYWPVRNHLKQQEHDNLNVF
jgi:hypothetical protein